MDYLRPAIWEVTRGGNPYIPFRWQAEHIHSKRAFPRLIAACGRRGGKTDAIVQEAAAEGFEEAQTVLGVRHTPLIYVVAPTTDLTRRIWTPLWNLFVPDESGSYMPPLGHFYKSHDKNAGIIELKNGATYYRKTADDPRSLQGDRVTAAFVDEAQDLNEDAWENLMPGLADSKGKLRAIGIPRGKGRFRSYFERGQSGEEGWYSASVPTSANPIFQQHAKDAGLTVEEYIRRTFAPDLTDNEFRRHYLAEWVEEDGQVFRNFDHLFTESQGFPSPDGTYVMGLDLGKLHDFTVLYVVNVATGKFVYRDRFNKLDYVDQVPRIIDVAKTWNVRFVHMDTNGPGEAPSEMLRRAGVSIVPFQWTNANKQGLVSTMVREVERGNVRFLKDDEVLKKEMGLFEATVTSGGIIRYEAPPGYHDDAVIAAALAIQKAVRNRSMAASPIRGSYFGMKTSRRVAAR